MAGNELENYATLHEKSNQQSEKQSFPNTNLIRSAEQVLNNSGMFAPVTQNPLISTVQRFFERKWK